MEPRELVAAQVGLRNHVGASIARPVAAPAATYRMRAARRAGLLGDADIELLQATVT